MLRCPRGRQTPPELISGRQQHDELLGMNGHGCEAEWCWKEHGQSQILVGKSVLKNTSLCSETESWPNLCTAATSELLWMVNKHPKCIWIQFAQHLLFKHCWKLTFFQGMGWIMNEWKWNLNSGWASGYFCTGLIGNMMRQDWDQTLKPKNWMKEEL